MIKKQTKEKRQEVIKARKAGLTIAQIAALGGVSMAERCQMEKLKGHKSRVQNSDNPETIVQQQKI